MDTVAPIVIDDKTTKSLETLSRSSDGDIRRATDAAVAMISGDDAAATAAIGSEKSIEEGALALLTAHLLGIRAGKGSDALQRTLEDAGISSASAARAASSLSSTETVSREALRTEDIPIHSLRGIRWRVDFTRRTMGTEGPGRVHQPLVILQIEYERPHGEGGGVVTKEFSCTRQQLSGLRARLVEAKEAAARFEGVSASPPTKGTSKRSKR